MLRASPTCNGSHRSPPAREIAWPFYPHPPKEGDLIRPGCAALILQAPRKVLLKSGADQWKHRDNDGHMTKARAVWRFTGEWQLWALTSASPHRGPLLILKHCQCVCSHSRTDFAGMMKRETLRRGDYHGL